MEETKSINIKYKYGAIYCYEIIQWNLMHCPLISNCVYIDNINCFEENDETKSFLISIIYNIKKNELIFRCSVFKNFVHTKIENKEKYNSFTIENFTIQFIYFCSLIEDFVVLKPIQYCEMCLKPNYRLFYKRICKDCYIKGIKLKINCEKCITNDKIKVETTIEPEIPKSKLSRFFNFFSFR